MTKCKFCNVEFYDKHNKQKKFCKNTCYWKWMKTQNKNNSSLIKNKIKQLKINAKINNNYGMKNKKQSQHCKNVHSIKRKNKKYENIYGEIQAKIIKKKMSRTRQKKKKKLGYVNSLETRQKLKQYKREKASQWRGGKSFELYGLSFDRDLKEKIRKKYKYICQLCNKKELKRKHSVHHIDYNKQNNNEENLLILCVKCHSMTNSNRKNWIKLFKRRLK